MLRAELTVAPVDRERLTGAGLVLVNPPWRLEAELAVLLPALAAILAQDGKDGARLDRLTAKA